MAKKKTVGPGVPAEPGVAAQRASGGAARRRSVRPDPGVAEPGATPMAEPVHSAADMSVGASSGDSAAAREPSYDEIAEAAYERYLQRGGNHGQDWDDWLEAERSLRTRR